MTIALRTSIFLMFFAAAGGAIAASAPFEPGLWRETSTNHSPDSSLARSKREVEKAFAELPEAIRKDLKAKALPGDSLTNCWTPELFKERWYAAPENGNCVETRQPMVGNKIMFSYSCTDPNASGMGVRTVYDSKHFNTRTVATYTRKGKEETVDMEVDYRWMSASCGTQKPLNLKVIRRKP